MKRCFPSTAIISSDRPASETHNTKYGGVLIAVKRGTLHEEVLSKDRGDYKIFKMSDDPKFFLTYCS